MNTLLIILASVCGGSLLLLIVAPLVVWGLDRHEQGKHPAAHTCPNCDFYQAGDLDARVNWVRCARGHCLIADKEKTLVHTTEDGQALRITCSGWSGGSGDGDAMWDRDDCPDWKQRGFRLEFHSMEY